MPYSWLTWDEAQAELSSRLSDTSQAFTVAAEVPLYLALAMQMWNALTGFWVAEYAVDLTPPLTGNWQQANGSGSPRFQTQTDVSLYTLIEYMLLEPPTGGTWTGTPQFNIEMLVQAVQGRRDEALQIGASNIVEVSLPIAANTSRVVLPDNALDVRRVRYVPAIGDPVTLERGDAESFRTFTPSYLQSNTFPLRYDVISGPPLAITLDSSVPVSGVLQILIMEAEAVPSPPSATALGIPDDYAWVPLFGALADLLGSQEESLDLPRAKYCMERYSQGLELLRKSPWLLEARVNGVAVATCSAIAADRFNVNWQTNSTAFPQLVTAGTDLYAVSPTPTALTSVVLVVVGNAPIPTAGSQEIQVPRDVMDAILDEAEHLACLKKGGSEFEASIALHKSFLATAKRWDTRGRLEGIFATTLRSDVPREDVEQPRFTGGEK
jgi:hypothetical protein